MSGDRLRQVDVKAEHFERQVQRVEVERDQWEKKYEESQEVSLARWIGMMLMLCGSDTWHPNGSSRRSSASWRDWYVLTVRLSSS